jgi:hypothetical protein
MSTSAGSAGRDCSNGYRFAKRQGKPNSVNPRKSASNMRFCDFVATCAERAFTFDSLQYLNCPSNLVGHDHPNKPANGVGE